MVSLVSASSSSLVPSEKEMEEQFTVVRQLQEFISSTLQQQRTTRNKRKRRDESFRSSSYVYGHLLYDVEFILADCSNTLEIIPEIREEVMKLKEKIVMEGSVVHGLETVSTLAPAVKTMKRVKVSAASSSSPVQSLEGEVCAICQEEFKVKDEVTVLSCSHNYHEECIFGWLASRGHCPVCRVELVSPDAAA